MGPGTASCGVAGPKPIGGPNPGGAGGGVAYPGSGVAGAGGAVAGPGGGVSRYDVVPTVPLGVLASP